MRKYAKCAITLEDNFLPVGLINSKYNLTIFNTGFSFMSIEAPTGLGDQFISKDYTNQSHGGNQSFSSQLSRSSSPNSARDLKERLKLSSDYHSQVSHQRSNANLGGSGRSTARDDLQYYAGTLDHKQHATTKPCIRFHNMKKSYNIF